MIQISKTLLKVSANPNTETLGSGEFHGGYGSASLRECLDRMASGMPTASAALHSGEGQGLNPPETTNPSQVMSPNVEQNQPQETTPVEQQTPDDASPRLKKREIRREMRHQNQNHHKLKSRRNLMSRKILMSRHRLSNERN